MQTAEDFIQNYLRELAELNRISTQNRIELDQKYCSDEIVANHQKFQINSAQNPESFVSAETLEMTAKVMTVKKMGSKLHHARYHLRTSGDSWQIYRQEWRCIVCDGSGKSSNDACFLCSGLGWNDPFKTVL